MSRWRSGGLCLLLLIVSFSVQADGDLLRREFRGFEVLIDCSRRGAVFFQYVLERDTGSFDRYDTFYPDPEVPEACQQTSTGTYRAPGQRYDRGHLVPANHLDHDREALRQSNMMTNILPQAANMNRGAWYQTERIAECYRDIGTVWVYGGVIWGDDLSDDFFLESHGVATPSAFWKVLVHEGHSIAWLVPNSQEATASRLDDYLITLPELSQVTGFDFPFPEALLADAPTRSWPIPVGCNEG